MNKKLLYLSCHSSMEAGDLEIFSSLGFDCVSVGNFLIHNTPYHKSGISYGPMNWTKHDWKEPNFNRDPELTHEFLHLNPNFSGITGKPLHITKEFISKFDVVVVSNLLDYLNLFSNIKVANQELIYCTVGQTGPYNEQVMTKHRKRIKIVRVGLTEQIVQGYCGCDAFITGFASPDFTDLQWEGKDSEIITVCRAMKTRAKETNYSTFYQIVKGMNSKVYGIGNENLDYPQINGGELTYEGLLNTYKNKRGFISVGSSPAPITYTFAEALSSGIPIIALGKALASKYTGIANLYDCDSYISNGENGFVSNDIKELKEYAELLLKDFDLAKKISLKGKEAGKKHFSKEAVSKKWENFFKALGLI